MTGCGDAMSFLSVCVSVVSLVRLLVLVTVTGAHAVKGRRAIHVYKGAHSYARNTVHSKTWSLLRLVGSSVSDLKYSAHVSCHSADDTDL